MSHTDYAERLALRNAAALAQAQAAWDNAAPPEFDEDAHAAALDADAAEMARGIIAAAAKLVQGIDDPRDRLARQVGVLQGEVRSLCMQIVWAKDEGRL